MLDHHRFVYVLGERRRYESERTALNSFEVRTHSSHGALTGKNRFLHEHRLQSKGFQMLKRPARFVAALGAAAAIAATLAAPAGATVSTTPGGGLLSGRGNPARSQPPVDCLGRHHL